MSDQPDNNKEVFDLFDDDIVDNAETAPNADNVDITENSEEPTVPESSSNLTLFDELNKDEYKNIIGTDRLNRDPRKRDMYMFMESEAERQLNEKTDDEREKEYKAARKEAQKRIRTAERHEKDVKRRSEDKLRDRNEFIQSENQRRNADRRQRKRSEHIRNRKLKDQASAEKFRRKNERRISTDYHKRKELEERKVAELRKKNTEPQVKRPLWKSFVEFICYVAFVVALSLFIINFVAQQSIIEGSSMLPNLHDGEHVLLEKVSYTFGDPERFDVIVFRVPNDNGKKYIKRVIGLPGETVQITDGVIYINGEILEEDFGLETMIYSGLASEPITVGEDEYFVLGDNRNDSTDSRFERVGLVNEDQIVGHAVVRIWPLTAISTVH